METYSSFLQNHTGTDTTLFVTVLKLLFHNHDITLTTSSVTPDTPLFTGQLTNDHKDDKVNIMRDETRDVIGCPKPLHNGRPTWFQTGTMTGLVMVDMVSEKVQKINI